PPPGGTHDARHGVACPWGGGRGASTPHAGYYTVCSNRPPHPNHTPWFRPRASRPGQCGHVAVDAWCTGTGAGAHTRAPRPGPRNLASYQHGLCPPLWHTRHAMAEGRASYPAVERGSDGVLYRVRLCTTFILGRVAARLGAAGARTEGAGPGADAPG